eukprot:CAMPEP_0203802990 /NCGR_PEP_ID=MMETSP0100_2-20121128/12508_1 /ASSEMBLY_ACC=CAM_ASM_000210 /TAXON_ID=96639 /ORGANISM=" , Strain NY0313808BC1" /LENGTH=126 /DNA_ID=CAMNT_0050710503 /DNA_START=423 /DNA_END=803 /DNA_ORIENTATION=+
MRSWNYAGVENASATSYVQYDNDYEHYNKFVKPLAMTNPSQSRTLFGDNTIGNEMQAICFQVRNLEGQNWQVYSDVVPEDENNVGGFTYIEPFDVGFCAFYNRDRPIDLNLKLQRIDSLKMQVQIR